MHTIYMNFKNALYLCILAKPAVYANYSLLHNLQLHHYNQHAYTGTTLELYIELIKDVHLDYDGKSQMPSE